MGLREESGHLKCPTKYFRIEVGEDVMELDMTAAVAGWERLDCICVVAPLGVETRAIHRSGTVDRHPCGGIETQGY